MELLKRVRLTQPALPLLVLTARNRTEDLVQALEQGADDCLIKPFSLLELLARGVGVPLPAAPPCFRRVGLTDLRIRRSA